MDKTHTERCIAEAEAAGWSGKAAQRLVIDPKSATLAGFRAELAEANEIRSMIKFASKQMEALGIDTTGAAEFFVSQGYKLEDVRADTIDEMARADPIINTARAHNPEGTANIYAARAAQIDANKAKTRV